MVDSSVRVVAANRSAVLAFSRPGVTLTGRRLTEVIRDLRLHDAFRQSVSDGTSSDIKLELTFNEKRTYEVHVAPLDLDGSRHSIGVFYDMTQVERLERVRQEFLSNISHELRTPLTSIMAFVETLEDGAIDDRENNRRFLSVIRRNAERMHALIADIAELSMIESGAVTIDLKRVRLAAIVDEIFTSLSSKAAERGVELVDRVDPEVRVAADPARLEQMLTNLIDNAIKFNQTGGSVTVHSEETADRVLISVSDTGEGIMPEHQHRIFERFYRSDRGRSRDIGGTGLGLAIVKHLARLHGGEVSVRSRLGEGSTFTIELTR
jgi:two-component system phosphate regulon sensor histidine kinase PhoR